MTDTPAITEELRQHADWVLKNLHDRSVCSPAQNYCYNHERIEAAFELIERQSARLQQLEAAARKASEAITVAIDVLDAEHQRRGEAGENEYFAECKEASDMLDEARTALKGETE